MSVNSSLPSVFKAEQWESLGVRYLTKGNIPVFGGDEHSVFQAGIVFKSTSSVSISGFKGGFYTNNGLLTHGNKTVSPGSDYPDRTNVYPSNLWTSSTNNTYSDSVYCWKRKAS